MAAYDFEPSEHYQHTQCVEYVIPRHGLQLSHKPEVPLFHGKQQVPSTAQLQAPQM